MALGGAMHAAAALAVAALAASVLSVSAPVGSQPAKANVAELWRDPGNVAAKDLMWGRGGKALAPSKDTLFAFRNIDAAGYSAGFDVVDPQGRKWDVKTGNEGQTEVLSSRLFWAIGFHQPIVYFVPEWEMKGGPVARPPSGRFRLSSDHDNGGEWSWDENPFKGTREFNGLVVANLIINNWDLKSSQNRIYTDLDLPGPSRWFVVQDLGASFGKTAWPVGNRNNIEAFESQKLVLGVEQGRVRFDYHARHKELLDPITPADVVWTCQLFNRITDQQWRDLFRGAAMPEETSVRYIRKIKSKIQEGLALASPRSTR